MTRRRRIRAALHHPLGILVAAGCGLLMWVAFPPRDLWWAAAVGAAGLTWLLRGMHWRPAFGYGMVAGLALFAPLLSWTSNVGVDAWLALAAMQALFFGALGVVLARVGTTRWWPLWTAAAWVAQEAVRGRLPFGGFTWGRLAFAQAEGPLLPYAGLGGAALVTFTTALLGTLLALALLQVARRRWGLALTATATVVALLVLPVLTPPAPAPAMTVSVAAVQGNVPQLGLDAFAQQRAVLDNHARATERLASDVEVGRVRAPDLVLWPENSSDLDPYTSTEAFDVIDEAVKAVGVPTLVGAVVAAGPGKVRNSGIVWDPESGPGATYVDFVKGTKTGVLDVGPARLGDA